MKGLPSLIIRIVVLVASLWVVVPATAFASGPWAWKMTLEGSPSGQFMEYPSALYIDAERERYYVPDSGNNRLLSFARDGAFLHSFTAEGRLDLPYDMVRDSDDVIWVVERGRNSLTSIDVKAQKIIPHNLQVEGKALLLDRLDIKDDLFYVLDKARGDLAVVNMDMQVTKWIHCPDCTDGFIDFKLDKNAIWTLQLQDKVVRRFSPDGQELQRFQIGDEVKYPVSLAIGPVGQIYVLDRHMGNIAVFDTRGSFKYRFLSKGQSRGQLYFPIEIQFDPWGGLCVVEEGNGRVQVFGR